MSISVSVTIDRTSLSASPLVISNVVSAGDYHLPEEAVDGLRPDFKMRRTYADDSPWVGGRQLLAAVSDASTLPLTFYAHASTQALLEAAITAAEAAFSQFVYTLTLTVGGQTRSWSAEPELPTWSADSGMVRAKLIRGSVVIPLNPA